MNDYYFDSATFKEVLPLILEHHYSRRRCADPSRVFVARGEDYSIQACAVFAAPVNRYFGRHAIELVRLVRVPAYAEPLSRLLAFSLKEIKRQQRYLYCLAYADTDANHHGGIYQACSFAYIGASKGHTMYRDGQTGKIISARSRDQSSKSTKARYTPFETGPKHLYVRGIQIATADVVARLGRIRMPYPKPMLE